MTERRATPRRQASHLVVAAVATFGLAVAASACGDDAGNGDSAAATIEAPAGTSAGGGDAVRGEQLARSTGCAGCHGQDFGGGAGPSLVGLAGAEVPLEDGTTVIADTAYLIRSIADPGAEVVADYNLRMPANNLSDAEIADVVAYIETLADG